MRVQGGTTVYGKKKCKNEKNAYVHFDRQTDVRTRTDVFLMNFSRTELISSLSRAKNCKESDFEVSFYVAPQKPRKNAGKQVFETKKISKQNFSGVEKSKLGNCLKRVLA